MRAALTCFFAAVLAVPLFAQATVTMELTVSDGHTDDLARVPVGADVIYRVSFSTDTTLTTDVPVEIDVPGTITSVISSSLPCEGTRPMRCTLGPPGSLISESMAIVTRVQTPGPAVATVRAQGREVSRTIEVIDLPSTAIRVFAANTSGRRVDPGATVLYQTTIARAGAAPTNVRVRYTLPNGGTFTAIRPADPAAQCSEAMQEVVCTLAGVDGFTSIDLDVRAPEQLTGGTVVLRGEVTQDQPDFDPTDNTTEVATRLVRGLAVTNTNDEGSGSLRQALLDAQALCADDPCSVLFNIPGTAPNGIWAITPKSPLPELRGWVKIDGATQPDARIAIFGNEAGLSHGLLLGEGCEFQVLNLSISGFAWPGIEVQRTFRGQACNPADLAVLSNIVIEGNELRENYRGIVLVDTPRVAIRNNIIERNIRSGIFVDGAFFVDVYRNRVVENGASGMFFNAGSRDTAGGAHVHENLVTSNAEWGITRTNSGWVAIQRNSIFANAGPAIDLNLDFETPNRPDDDFTSIPNKPLLISAHYDPVQQTTFVTGRLDTNNLGGGIEVDFYVDDHPTRRHMGGWLGSTFATGPGREFTFAYAGNLSGRWIVATSTRFRNIGFAKPPDVASDSHGTGLLTDTSEVSNAVPVQ